MNVEVQNVWVANLVTGGVVMAVLGYLLKRYIDLNDKRHDTNEHEMTEIKKNYNKKFEDVHIKVDQTKEEIIAEIKEIQKDRNEYRFQSAKAMGVLETKIDAATGYFRELRDDIKELRRDNRDHDRSHK